MRAGTNCKLEVIEYASLIEFKVRAEGRVQVRSRGCGRTSATVMAVAELSLREDGRGRKSSSCSGGVEEAGPSRQYTCML